VHLRLTYGCFWSAAVLISAGALILAGALVLAGAPGELILAEGLICAELLICVLNTKASAMEATPAKTVNDLFMVFFMLFP
jgi:hypothetical protein